MTTTHIQDSYPSHGHSETFGWQDRLRQATGRDEIVAIARDFLARISAEEYSLLPAECRPCKLVDADDVVDFAVTLVRRSRATDSMSDALLQRMASFFTDACSRLSQLGRHASAASAPTQ